MKMKMTKRGILVGCSALLAVTVCSSLIVNMSKGDSLSASPDTTYSVSINGSNGQATVASLKRSSTIAKTGLNSPVTFAYKNMEPVSEKVGKIKANGFYGNTERISGFYGITVASNAQVGDAKIVWGYTSACADGEKDLSEGTFTISGNYFKIIAENDVVVDSIHIDFSCNPSTNGYSAKNSSGEEVSDAFKFETTGSESKMSRSTNTNSVKRVVIPDYVIDSNVSYPLTTLSATGSTGIFESNSIMEEVYIPESVTTMEKYAFYTANQIKEFTLPYNLTSVVSNSVPKGALEVLNIESKNLKTAQTIISSGTDFKNLHTINVSYDVEFLPNIISSWPSQKPTIYYEGTTIEWGALTSVSGTSNVWKTYDGDVICSDTTISNVKMHFENATLGDKTNEATYKVITGKTFADPGKPVYNENAKKFDGWYTQATGGEKVVFPVTVDTNVDYYAHFVDWPAGSSLENPKAIVSGQTIDYETDEDVAWYYFSYTATKDEPVMFTNANVVKTGGSGNCTPALKLYDNTKTEITSYGSHDVATDIKKVARYNSGAEAWKVRFAAGETYYFALAVNKDGKTYGTGTFSALTAYPSENRDYTLASVYTLGDKVTCVPGKDFFRWYKFTPATTGSYWVDNGVNESTVWSNLAIGQIDGEAWTQKVSVNASIGSSSSAAVELTGGETYYIALSSNGNGNAVFKISNSVPQGASKSTAYNLTLNGDPVPSEYHGVANAWYKIVVSEAGPYLFRFGKVLGTSDISGQKLMDSNDVTVTMSNGATANDKVATLSVGTYYLTVPTTATKLFSVQLLTVPSGYNADTAISVSVPVAGTTLDLTYSQAGGTWFKFEAAKDAFVVFEDQSSFSGTFKIMSSQSTTLATMINGEVHTRVTAGTTYYICLTSGTVGTTYSFAGSYADTIQDGKTSETAFVVGLNETKTVTYVSGQGTSVYFHFTATEDGQYIISRVSNTYTLYIYDITNEGLKPSVSYTSGQTSNDKVATFEADHTYEFFYTYYSTHTFTISKVSAGYTFDTAISLTLTSVMNIENKFPGGFTYYKFTADETIFHSFTTADTATMKLFDSSKSEMGSSSTGELVKKLTNGQTYYFAVSTASATTVTVAFEKVSSVQDGRSLETALVATMGSPFSFDNDKSDREYIYIAVAVEMNTEYVMYTSTGKDIDGEYGAGVYTATGEKVTVSKQVQDIGSSKDTYNNVEYTIKDYATGAGGSDMYVRWNSGSNNKVVLKIRQYTGGQMTIVCNFMTADMFFTK